MTTTFDRTVAAITARSGAEAQDADLNNLAEKYGTAVTLIYHPRTLGGGDPQPFYAVAVTGIIGDIYTEGVNDPVAHSVQMRAPGDGEAYFFPFGGMPAAVIARPDLTDTGDEVSASYAFDHADTAAVKAVGWVSLTAERIAGRTLMFDTPFSRADNPLRIRTVLDVPAEAAVTGDELDFPGTGGTAETLMLDQDTYFIVG